MKTTVWRVAPAGPSPAVGQGYTSAPHVLGRRHRARSADALRSSDHLSSTSSLNRGLNPRHSTSFPDSSDPVLNTDRHHHHHRHHHHQNHHQPHHQKHAEYSISDPQIDHHRNHQNHSEDTRRHYHSDQHLHHHQPQNHHHHHHHHHKHHHHYNNNRHNNHHHNHHHHHPKEDEDRPLRRRRHKQRSSSQSSLPSTTSSDSNSAASRTTWMPKDTLNLSLCGCGFLGVYHLGVVSCLLKHGPSFLASLDRVAGASAGALAAALLVTSPTLKNVETSTEMVNNLAKTIRRKPLGALTPGYRMSDDVEMLLDKILPPDAHHIANGKLHVSITDVATKKNIVVSEFASRKELIQTLVASCHIPIYSGARYPRLNDKTYCDGGMTNNMVDFTDGRTVTVSPFSGKQDIGPRDALKKGVKGYYMNIQNLDVQVNLNNVRRFSHAFLPPRSQVLQQYLELGHKDASRFLVREGLYEIAMPGERPPVLYESSV